MILPGIDHCTRTPQAGSPRTRLQIGYLVAVVGLGCTEPVAIYDSFPITTDISSGAIITPVQTSSDDGTFQAVVDTMSPFTILDDFQTGDTQIPRQRTVDMTIFATDGTTPRARFENIEALNIHPCDEGTVPCQVGRTGDIRGVQAIIGADALSLLALRLDYQDSTMRLFPDIAGNEAARTRACDAVFPSAFNGSATLRLGDSEIAYQSRRVALGACLHFDATTGDANAGADTLFIMSTAIGTSLLTQSAYARYRAVVQDDGIAPAYEDLPAATVQLLSGPVPARFGQITRVALVGPGSDNRGSCRELYANHVLANGPCNEQSTDIADCPCLEDAQFCDTAAAVELTGPFSVAIVDDHEPALQALRDELRPAFPEVDGILGNDWLAATSLDLDYPNDRVLARCEDDSTCATRPRVRTVDATREDLPRCLNN